MPKLSLSLEGSKFYLNGASCHITIAEHLSSYHPERHTAVMIPVDLSLDSSLDFHAAKSEAEYIRSQGGLVVWSLHLDLRGEVFFEGILHAHEYALKRFSEEVIQPFEEITLGCSLFQGECDLSDRFPWNVKHHQDLLEWLEDLYRTPEHLFEMPASRPSGEIKQFQDLSAEAFAITPYCRHLRNIYWMNLFAGYLHRLAASLPEELFVFVCFDACKISHPAYLYQLLSKERFSYLHLAVKGSTIPLEALVWEEGCIKTRPEEEPKVGLCFPNDPACLQSTLQQFKKVMTDLNEQKIATQQVAYRIIPEFLMTSSWEGLDEIIFLQRALSPQGKRILQGFSITGGRLIYLDQPCGFEEEISYEEFTRELTLSKS